MQGDKCRHHTNLHLQGSPVATVYSANNFDIPRIQSLLQPLPRSYAGDENIPLNVPEQQADSRNPTQDSLDEANLGQLSPSEKGALMEVPKQYADFFTANSKPIAACRGPPLRFELKAPNSAAYVAPIRLYTHEQENTIQAEMEKLRKAGAIVPLTSQYASCCHIVRKKMGPSE